MPIVPPWAVDFVPRVAFARHKSIRAGARPPTPPMRTRFCCPGLLSSASHIGAPLRDPLWWPVRADSSSLSAADGWDDAYFRLMTEATPLGRIGTATDVANAVALLTSQKQRSSPDSTSRLTE